MKNVPVVNPGVPALDSALVARYAREASEANRIDPEFYRQYNVKRGLRNADGSGVLVGLTTVGSVVGYSMMEQEIVPVPGRLLYRGIEIRDIVKGFQSEGRFGFEEVAFLLLVGHLPTKAELDEFNAALDSQRPLPPGFKEDAILGMPSPDVMNKLARCVLASYAFDANPDDTSVANVLRQSIGLVSRFPTYAVYGFQAKAHYYLHKSLHMRIPDPGLSTAEHILCLLRPHSRYTKLEAELLDLCLVLHADHGGGNNSTFTTQAVSSTYTDTYSAIAAACLSLKGPRHGGANLEVRRMMDAVKTHVKDWESDAQVAAYLTKILDKKAYDRRGLVYGLGHAVYKVSDPRAEILREKASQLLAEHPSYRPEFELYAKVSRIGGRLLQERRRTANPLPANVDFWSGLVYKMLGIPIDLFTPLFAVGRVPGWCAHRLEELNGNSRIIRPASARAAGRPLVAFAPMAEITDSAFRAVAFARGADLCVSEMVSAAGLVRDSRNTAPLLERLPEERGPTAVQLYGAVPAELEEAARRLAGEGAFEAIDLNAGCPAKKVLACGAGAALLREPALFARCVEAVARGAGGAVPVTVKTRIGPDPAHPIAAELARLAEAAGASLLAMHGRYASRIHSGPVDAARLAEAVAAVRELPLPELLAALREHLRLLGALKRRIAERHPGAAGSADPEEAVAFAFRRYLFNYFRGRSGVGAVRRRLGELRGTADILAAVRDAFPGVPAPPAAEARP